MFECLDNLCLCVLGLHSFEQILFNFEVILVFSHRTSYLQLHDWGKNTAYLCLLPVFTFVLGILKCFNITVVLVFLHLQLLHDRGKNTDTCVCWVCLPSSLSFWYVSILQSFWSSRTCNYKCSYMTQVRNYILVYAACLYLLPWSFALFKVCSYFGLLCSRTSHLQRYEWGKKLLHTCVCLLGVYYVYLRPWPFVLLRYLPFALLFRSQK